MTETKICDITGETMYKCPECKEWECDMADSKQCRVCWEMEHHPETFTLTEEQCREWDEASNYVMKHNITPNLDSPDA